MIFGFDRAPMSTGQLFSRTTQALVYNYKQLPIQRMLDFDFLCGRETPSVAGIINHGAEGFQKLFFGQEEIAIPVHSTVEAACAAHPTADLALFLDENKQHDHIQKEVAQNNKEHSALQLELQKRQEELEMCRNNLSLCLERNEKLCREIADLNTLLENQKSATHDHGGAIEVIKESILEAPSVGDQSLHTIQKATETHVNYIEEVMNHQLELDILKMILKEESSSHGETVEILKSIEEKYS